MLTHDRAEPTLKASDIFMGLTYIHVSIANPARPRRSARLKFLVDSGALYSVVPAPVLRRLGIKPGKTKSFILADGTEIKRSLGEARFRFNGEEGTSPVIFGEKGDSVLLGSISLEVLGFMLDPFKRQLRPMPMILASHRPAWSSCQLSVLSCQLSVVGTRDSGFGNPNLDELILPPAF